MNGRCSDSADYISCSPSEIHVHQLNNRQPTRNELACLIVRLACSKAYHAYCKTLKLIRRWLNVIKPLLLTVSLFIRRFTACYI